MSGDVCMQCGDIHESIQVPTDPVYDQYGLIIRHFERDDCWSVLKDRDQGPADDLDDEDVMQRIKKLRFGAAVLILDGAP
jgi:hypothetical protein